MNFKIYKKATMVLAMLAITSSTMVYQNGSTVFRTIANEQEQSEEVAPTEQEQNEEAVPTEQEQNEEAVPTEQSEISKKFDIVQQSFDEITELQASIIATRDENLDNPQGLIELKKQSAETQGKQEAFMDLFFGFKAELDAVEGEDELKAQFAIIQESVENTDSTNQLATVFNNLNSNISEALVTQSTLQASKLDDMSQKICEANSTITSMSENIEQLLKNHQDAVSAASDDAETSDESIATSEEAPTQIDLAAIFGSRGSSFFDLMLPNLVGNNRSSNNFFSFLMLSQLSRGGIFGNMNSSGQNYSYFNYSPINNIQYLGRDQEYGMQQGQDNIDLGYRIAPRTGPIVNRVHRGDGLADTIALY